MILQSGDHFGKRTAWSLIYTFWTMPLLIFSPVYLLMRHPLHSRIHKPVNDGSTKKIESQYPQAQFRRFWHKIVPKDPLNTLVGSLMRVVKLSSSSSWTAAAVPKIKARLRLPTSTMKPPPQKLASNLCLHSLLSVLEDILISYFSLKTFEERIIQLF